MIKNLAKAVSTLFKNKQNPKCQNYSIIFNRSIGCEMASSESSMDFSARVSKIFDSLGPTKSRPWSLTDNEVERREWRRETDTSDRDERPCSASFDDFLKEERRSRNSRKEFDGDQLVGDDWEIRSSIGLDPTLDHEDEEDEYDKVASGRFYAGERVYMGDITDRGSYLNWQNVLPDPLCGTTKDRRANSVAAEIRLKEDEAEAKIFHSHHVGDTEVKKPQPRSILKRKENNEDFKSKKRVRFDPGCKTNWEEASEQFQDDSMSICSVNATVSDDGSLQVQNTAAVPDYLLNPSRYTRYSFDSSSEVDDGSNTQAFMDFLKLVKRSDPTQSRLTLEVASADLPKSVTFIPKKKAGDVKAVENNSESKQNKEDDSKQTLHKAVFPVGIAAGEAQVSAIEEDEPETNAADKGAAFQKPGRRYRTKSRSDDSDSC